MPDDVKDVFGAAFLDAQFGDHPQGAPPFGEGTPRGVMKLVEDADGDTYRAAYTVSFPECVYVLHVFQKKSRSGASPRRAPTSNGSTGDSPRRTQITRAGIVQERRPHDR